jgi:hypothetical protein
MSTDRIVALEERLVKLERERRVSTGLVVLSLALLVASQTAAPHAQPGPETKFKAPFKVVNNVGETIFSVESVGSETRVSIIDNDFVVAGMNGSKDGSSLHLSAKDGIARLGMNFDGPATGPSILMKDADGEVLTVGSKAASLKAPLTVTTGDSGKEDALELIGSMSVRDLKGRRGASVSPTALRVHGADGSAVAASLGVDEGGKGRLVVGLSTGPRGVLAQPSGGGISFALFDGPGKDYRAGLLAVPGDVAFFRINAGKQQATMIADTTHAAVNLFNASGHAAASLSSKSDGTGQLELGDSDGDTTIEAGTTSEGLGVVRAGPRMGGVVGFEGSLPFAILGKRAR